MAFITADKPADDITSAIRNGDAKSLAKYFHTNLDVTISDTEGTYSKAQAEMIVKDFFSKNPPKSYKINHQGNSTDGSGFIIGTYTTSQTTFKNYILLKKFADKIHIIQLRFEKE